MLGVPHRRPRRHHPAALPEVDRDRCDPELADIDPAEVEQVVDEVLQAAAGVVDEASEVARLGEVDGLVLEVGKQELAEADHRPERRAQLVADPREEVATGLVRGAGLVEGVTELAPGVVEVRDVGVDAEVLRPVRGVEHRDAGLNREGAAVRSSEEALVGP